MLHKECNRNSDKKSSAYTLYHYELGFLYTVIEANEAEKEAGEKAVYSIGFQVIPRSCNCIRLIREYSRKHISVEESNKEHNNAE